MDRTAKGAQIMAKFEGRGKCDCCKKGVDVYSDRSGMAYYNCGPCGFRGLHRSRRTSDAVLAGLDREAEADDGAPPAPPADPVGVLPVARPAARPPAATKAPPAPTPPAPKKPGFLSNFTL